MTNTARDIVKKLGPEPKKALGALLDWLPAYKTSFTRNDMLDNLELSNLMNEKTQKSIEELTTNKYHPRIMSCAGARIASFLKSGLIKRISPRNNNLAIYGFLHPVEDLRDVYKTLRETEELAKNLKSQRPEAFQAAKKSFERAFKTAQENGDAEHIYKLTSMWNQSNKKSPEIEALINNFDAPENV